MAKKNKTGKLQYQLAFEYRSLKWLVLEIVLFSVFAEMVCTYFKVKNIASNDDVAFAPFVSGGLWQILFYATMIVGFFGVAYVIFGDRIDFNSMYALRTLPIETKYIVISKIGVSIIAMLGIYGSQLISFVFTWSLYADNVPVAKRVSHALNYALVKDSFIYATFPSSIVGLFLNVVVIIFLVIGFSYLLYSLRTRDFNKVLFGGIYFIINLVAAIVLSFMGVRVPFVPVVAKEPQANMMIGIIIIIVVYLGALGFMIKKMYDEFLYD